MDGNQRSGGIPEDFFEKSQKSKCVTLKCVPENDGCLCFY